MAAMLLKKDNQAGFIHALAGSGRTVWAPVERGGLTRFVPGAGDTVLAKPVCSNSTIPPKSIIFPQTETLYRFKPGETVLDQPVLNKETVLLGVRPCDARAVTLLEKIFTAGVGDPYYARRRELTTVIGLACREPKPSCFCTVVGGGPASTEGLDLLLHDLDGDYLIEIITVRGRILLEELQEYLEESPDEVRRAAAGAAEESATRIRHCGDTAALSEGLPQLWEHPLWEHVATTCLGCGICTFLCPTCHCFDIHDEVENIQGRRYRTWDSCMFEEYTRHASGHNPRPSRRERIRNRINHKYSYFVKKFGAIACVGCGRCIEFCPVNIDLTEILRQVKEALPS